MSHSSLQQYLAQHPRMIGVLATMVLLLSQTDTTLARGCAAVAVHGP